MSGWFFSGLNCAIATMRMPSFSSSLRSGSSVRCSTLHGGYTRWVFNGHFQIVLIWSSVHEEFTITISAQLPTNPYNWNVLAWNNCLKKLISFYLQNRPIGFAIYLHAQIIYSKVISLPKTTDFWRWSSDCCARRFSCRRTSAYRSK